MRKTKFVPNEYYHIYNRGNDGKPICHAEIDFVRLMFLILLFQAPSVVIPHINRLHRGFVQHSVLDIKPELIQKIIAERAVELICFTLMPNHFHLLLREVKEKGISRYMQRVLDAYTKYFNTIYEKSGHLFQGPFGAKYIETNEQLLYTSAYIHRNQRELSQWYGKEALYPWSSYYDYVEKNRWGKLLCTDRLMEQFTSPAEYKELVETSAAKEHMDEETITI